MTCTDKTAEIRPGDEFDVTERLTVERISPNMGSDYFVHGDGKAGWVTANYLLAGRRVARPLAIGDRVRLRGALEERYGYTHHGEVVAIRGDYAFIDWTPIPDCLTPSPKWPLPDLERAPAPDTKEGTA